MKLKFQDKFYNIIDHNKCPSSEKQNQKCILRKSYFHQIQPINILCKECERLKSLEDKWMCRLGTLNTNKFGLNSRDEIVSRSRVNVRLNRDGGV